MKMEPTRCGPAGPTGPKTPLIAVDCVIVGPDDRILLVERNYQPFVNCFSLPGGFVDVGETTEAAARREVMEEVGLELGPLQLVGVYSDPERDTRGHVVSVAYVARPLDFSAAKVGDENEVASVLWASITALPDIAFDHKTIMLDAFEQEIKT